MGFFEGEGGGDGREAAEAERGTFTRGFASGKEATATKRKSSERFRKLWKPVWRAKQTL